jgi:glucose/arabinose dehydrogenase
LVLAVPFLVHFEKYQTSGIVAVMPPTILDPNLEVDLVFQKEIKREGGTLSPVSSMTFIGINDILLLNKNNGTIHRILNGVMLQDPLLDVNVANERERGMLGIATSINAKNGDRYVFLYYTESKNSDGSDTCHKTYSCKSDSETIGNNLYRYTLKDNKLVNPKLLLHLPSWPAPAHNGGVVEIGPDNNVYVTIGDLVGSVNETSRTKAQNYKNGTVPDGRAGILRVTQDGKSVLKPILGDEFPLNLYYAYGIRNSFGIDFDPITGKLWDTENGPDFGDEINLVGPGFNSGWEKVQGIWKTRYDAKRGGDLIAGIEISNPNTNILEDFNGNGKYSIPEFVWNQTVAPSQIVFLSSDKYQTKYINDIFVGDTNNGYLYHFDLSNDRNKLLLNGTLADGVANSTKELDEVIFGRGFGQITDLEVSPDGYLFVLTHYNNLATIFRITPVGN